MRKTMIKHKNGPQNRLSNGTHTNTRELQLSAYVLLHISNVPIIFHYPHTFFVVESHCIWYAMDLNVGQRVHHSRKNTKTVLNFKSNESNKNLLDPFL